jgi:hypothetical protein
MCSNVHASIAQILKSDPRLFILPRRIGSRIVPSSRCGVTRLCFLLDNLADEHIDLFPAVMPDPDESLTVRVGFYE